MSDHRCSTADSIPLPARARRPPLIRRRGGRGPVLSYFVTAEILRIAGRSVPPSRLLAVGRRVGSVLDGHERLFLTGRGEVGELVVCEISRFQGKMRDGVTF